MDNYIESPANPKIKSAIKLLKSGDRKKRDRIIIEGYREIGLAIDSKLKIETLFYCPEFSKDKSSTKPFGLDKGLVFTTDKKAFKKISHRENPDGFIAVAKPKIITLETIKLSTLPLMIVLESVEKPGNLGAILRTADAARVDAVLVADPKTDIYNPNVIRASQGTIFSNQVVTAGSKEILSWLEMKKINIIATTPAAEKFYTDIDYKVPSAILMGTEDKGLKDFWINNSSERIKIPMQGRIDSLNVSVTTAIIVFEALRQRTLQ
jgi:RNA methyltransferase, TrmH family